MSVKLKKGKNKTYRGKIYDDKLTQELSEKIEEITNSGKISLEESDFLIIKNICRRSDKYVKDTFSIVLEHLGKNHAEIRRSAFQICDKIFRRSHCFRELVVNNLEEIVKLTTSDDLPLPQKVARELRQFALRCIHEWNTVFGELYKKLSIGYRYLQEVKKIDFNACLENPSGHNEQQSNNTHATAVNEARKMKILADIKEKKDEIKTTVTSLSRCINLLLPHPDEFFISMDEGVDQEELRGAAVDSRSRVVGHGDSSDSDEGSGDVGLREVGMVNVHHTLQLDFTPSSQACIEETPENSVIIENVREYAKVIQNKYLPVVKAWLAVLSKSSGCDEEKKDLTELKGDIDDVLFKYGRMVFISNNDVSSDSELEEVPEPSENKQNTPSSSTSGSMEWSILSDNNRIKADVKEECRPSTSSAGGGGGGDRKQRLLAVAPKRPFDIDLYHWEDDKLPVPTLVPSSTDGHRFWVGSEGSIDELPVPDGAAVLRTRVIEFTGDFTPVTHSCRVRLPSGKLCPRRDRYKCPFHGEIVPRDESGNCINPKDAIRIQQLREKQQQEKPDWQNPKLLADIKKATGIDLKMPEKGRRKKRKNQCGLTDLKESENSTKKRLERKIFKRSVMKKVATAMDKLDHRKFKDKFGDQFHYFYDT